VRSLLLMLFMGVIQVIWAGFKACCTAGGRAHAPSVHWYCCKAQAHATMLQLCWTALGFGRPMGHAIRRQHAVHETKTATCLVPAE
jgi:hypothetical protein